MIALIQRALQASVAVAGETIGEIGAGLLILLGVEKGDTPESAQKLVDKVLGYRIFADEGDKMNLNVLQAGAACWWCRSSRWRPILKKACGRASPVVPLRRRPKNCTTTLSPAAVKKVSALKPVASRLI